MFRHLKFLLTLSFCLIFLNSFSQTINNRYRGIGWMGLEKEENYIKGTRYLHDDFIIGDVYYNGKRELSQVPLRLNLHNDEFEYMDNGSVFAIAEPYKIDKIVIENEVFIYLNRSFDPNISGFVKRWNSELPSVLTKMRIDFFKKVSRQAFVEPKPDRFERAVDKHYIMNSINDIIEITSVKKLIKFLGTHNLELTEYSNKEKISAKKPEELAQFLEYYHTLN